MSITNGFEGRSVRAYEFRGSPRVYTANDVLPLLAHARALEAMLKRVRTECVMSAEDAERIDELLEGVE